MTLYPGTYIRRDARHIWTAYIGITSDKDRVVISWFDEAMHHHYYNVRPTVELPDYDRNPSRCSLSQYLALYRCCREKLQSLTPKVLVL